ncbi:MAG TPA: hypothetical protein VK132_13130, partial [Gemmatimonadales bacterium]|nr:hypothetical protein [Gemmatimonadales bacterium]
MIRQDGTTGGGGQPVGGDWYQRWFPLAVTFAFLGLAGFAIANHELWRDETQAWLIARDSSSLTELFRHTRYEGHPGLWFICLFILSRVTTSPIAMQVLHLGIGAGTVWIFARYAPFTLWQRALFAFGYFPLFEYTVVSRDYGLGVLLLLGACAVLGAKPTRFPLLVTLLALVPQTNAFAAMLGLALGLALLVDLRLPGGPMLAVNATRRQYVWGLVVVGVSLGLAAAQMIPPADSGIFVGWHTHLEWGLLGKRLRSLGAAVFPVPTIQNRWWISPFLWDLEPVRVPLAIIVYALFTWVAISLTRRLRALTFLVAALSAQLAFIYLKFPGEMRHWGHFFVA